MLKMLMFYILSFLKVLSLIVSHFWVFQNIVALAFDQNDHRLLAPCQLSSDNYFVNKLNCVNDSKSKYRRFQDMINVIQYGKTNTHVGDHHENIRSNDFNFTTRKS